MIYNVDAYYRQLESMNLPTIIADLPKIKVDMQGAYEYANKKGVSVAQLSPEEKKMFMVHYGYNEH